MSTPIHAYKIPIKNLENHENPMRSPEPLNFFTVFPLAVAPLWHLDLARLHTGAAVAAQDPASLVALWRRRYMGQLGSPLDLVG